MKKIVKYLIGLTFLFALCCAIRNVTNMYCHVWSANTEQMQVKNRKEANSRIVALFSLEGHITWIDDYYVAHPYQYGKVDIIDNTNGNVLEELYTDRDGYYHTGLSTGISGVYLRIYAQGENISVVSPDEEIYTCESDVVYLTLNWEDAFDGPDILDYTITMDAFNGQAMQIAQAGIVATRYVREMNGSYLSPVTIEYPHNEEHQNDFYNAAQERIYLLKPKIHEIAPQLPPIQETVKNYSNWDMIMHEYGHHVQYKLGITLSPGGRHDGTNLIAEYGKSPGVRLAWGEAYPTVFGALAQEYYKNELDSIEVVGDSAYSRNNGGKIDFEVYEYSNFSLYASGEGGEFAIISVLWDLFDDENQGVEELFDSISMTHQEHWNMMKNSRAYTMSDFVNYYYQTHTNQEINEFAKILSQYGFSVSGIGVEETYPGDSPVFTWNSILTATKNGINYYHERYQFVFYDDSFNEVYRSDIIDNRAYININDEGACRYHFDTNTWSIIQELFGGHQYSVSLISWQMEVVCDDNYVTPTGGYITPRLKLTFRKPVDSSYASLSGTNSQTFVLEEGKPPVTRYAFSTTDRVMCSVDYEAILESQNLQAAEVDTCRIQIVGLRKLILECYLIVQSEEVSYLLEYTADNGIHEIDIAYLYNMYGVTSFTIMQKEESLFEEIITEETRIFIQAKVI